MNEKDAQLLDTLEAVTKQMAVGVTRCSRDFRYLWANQAYANWIQHPLNEIVERPILEVLGRNAFEALLPYFNQVLSGQTVRYEQETNSQGVGPRWTSVTYSPTLDANGVTDGWVAVVVDISEPRSAEQALRESEERLRLAAQAGRMFAFSWDAATDAVERSGESAEILGVAQGAVTTGAAVFAMVHPADKELLETVMAKLTTESPCLQISHRMIRPDGAIIWLERNIRAYFDKHGKVKRIIGMVLDVTERKRAEVALLRLAAIVESSDDAIIGTDLGGTVTNWNKGAEQLLGYTAIEAIGKSISFLRAPDRSEEGQANLKKVMNGNVVKPYETVLQRKDGTLVDVSLRISPIVDSEGRIVGASGICRDISERKESENALRESEERFRSLYENSTLGLYRTTPDGKILLANPSLVKMLGYSSFSEIAQRNLEEEGFEPGYERAEFQHRLATEGEIKGLEASWTRKDRSTILVRESAKAIRDAEGKTAYYEGTVEDITKRRRAEEALRQSEEKFSKAFRESPLVVALTRMRDHRYLDVSESFEQWIGWRREEVIGRTPRDIGIWVDPAERSEFVKRLQAEGVVRNLEFRYRRKDGAEMVGLGSGELIQIGNEQCVISVITDITERKLVEERVRVSEERLRLAQWAARIGTFDLNIRTGVDNWTPELEALYGLPPGGFAGTLTAFENLIHPDDRQRVIELTREMMRTGQPAEGEWRVIWPDGSVHWIAGRGQMFMDETGGPSRMLGVNMDITERKRAEEALARMTRKLVEAQEQERARVSRELHDDINQRIALLALELDQLREKHKDLPSKVRSHVQKLQQMTSDLSSRVYAMSHELYFSIPDSLGLAKGMRSWCREFGKQQKMEVDLKCQDVPRLPQEISLCLFRVLQEALHNAAKHSGVERIDVRLAENSGEIQLIVSDSGRGFDLNAARRSGGLGLMSMQERVRLVGGTILIDSNPLAGTTIRVCVPFRAEHTG
jgi:PAS domain S-box-containing protein